MITESIHERSIEEVLELMGTSRDGLAAEAVVARQFEFGLNQWDAPSRLRWTRVLSKHLINFFSLLLLVAAIACFVAESLQPGEGMGTLGWVLISVAVVNSLFAFAQEMRAERAMEELEKFLPQAVRVRRGGSESEVPADQLVPGDLVVVTEGDQIAADARLIETEELLVNNSPLTGESRSLPMNSEATRGPRIHSHNLLFAGCSVLRGSGCGIVYATGHDTEFGRLATLSRDVQRPRSPIENETRRMIRVLTVVAMVLGILFFAWGVGTGRSLWVNVVFMLGIIVANVPEGLLPTFTLALSMASLRMAKKRVLVKSLEAVESLGAVHVICTDKTGTLTRNEMAITGLVDSITGEEIRERGRVENLLRAALIASELRDGDPWYGDPLDVALAQRYSETFGSPREILERTRRHLPFDLQMRREAGVYAHEEEFVFAIKGAWETLRPLIASVASDSEQGTGTSVYPVPVAESILVQCDAQILRIAKEGKRVIAVAHSRLNSLPDPGTPEASLEQSLILLGFVSLEDPLRAEVPSAIAQCHQAGIRILMITGDHPDTAEAIAREAGILSHSGGEGLEPNAASSSMRKSVMLGAELDQIAESEIIERLETGLAVFARTTPDQKLKIVNALKRMELVVAMTGDGVNDAPALKAANVGIAMGCGGTDVAREAADVVLLDDNFASIVAGVEEGRAVFRNMQKFTTYVLSSNVPEIVPLLLYIVFPVPLALTVVQILSIDLGTDLLPAIGLGQEAPETEEMALPPRPPHERLLSAPVMVTAYLFLGLIQAAWSIGLFFLVLLQGGWQWGQELASDDPLYRSATGITLATVILMQIGNVIGRRSLNDSGLDRGLFHNPLIVTGILVEMAFSWGVLYWAPLQKFLGTGPVAWPYYVLAWLGVPLLLGLDRLRKCFANRDRGDGSC